MSIKKTIYWLLGFIALMSASDLGFSLMNVSDTFVFWIGFMLIAGAWGVFGVVLFDSVMAYRDSIADDKVNKKKTQTKKK
jgi:hypothetical protein